ncbi:IucC family-domain-containing protein [Paraphysoderma sedebokerense]|nr:IucC family-domain-containing protein [Paraphysoderma sedebokerense]
MAPLPTPQLLTPTVSKTNATTHTLSLTSNSDLANRKAQFATTRRLIAALINEGIIHGYLLKSSFLNSTQLNQLDEILHEFDYSFWVVCFHADEKINGIQGTKTKNGEVTEGLLVPLKSLPYFDNVEVETRNGIETVQKIKYIDPEDFISTVYHFGGDGASNFDKKDGVHLGHANGGKQNGCNGSVQNSYIGNGERTVETNEHMLPGLRECLAPVGIIGMVAKWCDWNHEMSEKIATELQSSVENQAELYRFRNMEPTIESSSWEWEQSLIEGHGSHPMHRTRLPMHPLLPTDIPKTLAYHTFIRFCILPSSSVHAHGTYLTHIHPHLIKTLKIDLPQTHILLPYHSTQQKPIQSLCEFLNIQFYTLQNQIPALPQASLRTVSPISDVLKGYHLKLSLSVVTTSALRTISHYSVHNGPIISELAEKVIQYCSSRSVDFVISMANSESAVFTKSVATTKPLKVTKEIASVGILPTPIVGEQVKVAGCIFRTDPEFQGVTFDQQLVKNERIEGEQNIVCAALVERAVGVEGMDTDAARVVNLFGLDTVEKKLEFLECYATHLLNAIIPPLLHCGFAFESHSQNMILRVAPTSSLSSDTPSFNGYSILGFIVRDFGGVRIHRSTVESNQELGFKLVNVLNGSCIVTDNIEEVYLKSHHTTIHSHLHRLIRALDLYASPPLSNPPSTHLHHPESATKAWSIVRRIVQKYIPQKSDLHNVWFQKEIQMKCFLEMKKGGLYRNYLYHDIPNVLLTDSN